MALALWRLSSLVASEPIFAWPRERLGVIHDSDGYPVGHTSAVGQGAQCLWCVSVWLSPIALLLTTFAAPVAVCLALSTIAIGLSLLISGRD